MAALDLGGLEGQGVFSALPWIIVGCASWVLWYRSALVRPVAFRDGSIPLVHQRLNGDAFDRGMSWPSGGELSTRPGGGVGPRSVCRSGGGGVWATSQ